MPADNRTPSAAISDLREPMHQAYGYLVALVNHGGETKVAATKARDHLREAIRRLDALTKGTS